MTIKKEDLKRRLEREPNFIASKRFDYNLDNFKKRYPNGAPNKVIANCLMLSEDELEDKYQKIILKIRKVMKVNL